MLLLVSSPTRRPTSFLRFVVGLGSLEQLEWVRLVPRKRLTFYFAIEYVLIRSYLNEDNFVMFLSLTDRDGSLRSELFGLWWGYVNVDVLLDGGAASSEATSESAAESATSTAAASKTTSYS